MAVFLPFAFLPLGFAKVVIVKTAVTAVGVTATAAGAVLSAGTAVGGAVVSAGAAVGGLGGTAGVAVCTAPAVVLGQLGAAIGTAGAAQALLGPLVLSYGGSAMMLATGMVIINRYTMYILHNGDILLKLAKDVCIRFRLAIEDINEIIVNFVQLSREVITREMTKLREAIMNDITRLTAEMHQLVVDVGLTIGYKMDLMASHAHKIIEIGGRRIHLLLTTFFVHDDGKKGKPPGGPGRQGAPPNVNVVPQDRPRPRPVVTVVAHDEKTGEQVDERTTGRYDATWGKDHVISLGLSTKGSHDGFVAPIEKEAKV